MGARCCSSPATTTAVNAEFAAFGEALGFAPVLVGGLREGGRLMQLGGPLSALHVIKQD